MKSISKLLFISFLLLSVFSFSQEEPHPMNDAIKYNNAGTLDPLRKQIISKYVVDDADLKEFERSGYVKFPTIANKSELDGISEPPTNTSHTGNSGGLGGPLIDAIATFMANRFREELTISFLNTFREKLRNEKYLGSIFPSAKNVMLTGDIFDHKSWLGSLRSGLEEDLRNLPKNFKFLLVEIKENAKLSVKWKKTFEVIIAAYDPAYQIAVSPEKSYSSLNSFLENIVETDIIENNNLKGGVLLSKIILKELGTTDYTDWQESSTYSKFTNPETVSTFIGFSIQLNKTELKAINIDDNGVTKSLYDYVTSTGYNHKYAAYVNEVITHVREIGEEIKTLKKIQGKRKLGYGDYENLIDLSLIFTQKLTNNVIIEELCPSGQGDRLKTLLKTTNAVARYGLTVKENIEQKEYHKIIVGSVDLLSELIPQEIIDNSKALKEFIKYAQLAANLASAKNADEIGKALEASALPTGSYRLKRNSFFSISLNGYPGLYTGYEWNRNPEALNQNSIITGFTAPVGIGFNWGIRSKVPTKYSRTPAKVIMYNSNGDTTFTEKTYFKGHSFSIFMSFIDVGAITAFRLTNDETPVENIQWKNVFAPGLKFVWGVGNTPLALSLGGQYGPALREVTAVNGVATPTITTSSFRADLSLTVDIPIFHFYTKTDKFKDKTSPIPTDFTKISKAKNPTFISPDIKVKLHDIKGYSDKQKKYANKGVELLEKVLNSKEFYDEIIAATFEQKNGLSNQQIYNLIVAGIEERSGDMYEAGVIDLFVRTMSYNQDGRKWMRKCRNKTIGKEGDKNGYIATCSEKMNMWIKEDKPEKFAAHYVHEYIHHLGFIHSGRENKRLKSVVYVVDDIVEKLAEKL